MITKIMAATPTYTGQVCIPFLNSYVLTWAHLAVNGVQMELAVANHFTLVQFARNYLLKKFLDDESFTHLLWIDSDLGWSPDAVLRMLAREKDVIAGVYPLKQQGPLQFPYVEELTPNNEGIQLAERAPSGFMLCTREAITKVAMSCRNFMMNHAGEKFMCPNVFDLIHEGIEIWGEDFVLCKRFRNLGIDVWVECNIDFQHIGLNAWNGNLVHKVANGPLNQPISNLPKGPTRSAA